MRNDGTAFALQTARPSLGSNDHVKWRSRLQLETLKYGDFVTNMVSPGTHLVKGHESQSRTIEKTFFGPSGLSLV